MSAQDNPVRESNLQPPSATASKWYEIDNEADLGFAEAMFIYGP